MKKKFFAVALATTMVSGSTFSTFAADTASSTVEPVATYSFDDASDFTMNGSASVVANPDDAEDKVLCVETGVGGQNGNYAITKAGIFENVDFSKGITVSMNVRPTANSSDWNYLFSVGTTESPVTNGYLYVDGTIGFIQRMGDPYFAAFPGDGWVDGNTVNNAYDYYMQEANADKWYKLTYVYSESELAIYVDGVLAVKHLPSELDDASAAALEVVLPNLNRGTELVLGAGASRGDFENFGGYIDDVMVYASALSADEVKAIPEKVVVETEDPSEEVTDPSEEVTDPSEEVTDPSEEVTDPSEEVTDPSVEATNPIEDSNDFDITDADAADVQKDTVVTGLPANVTLRVASIEKSSDNYQAIEKFVDEKLKGKKVAAADLSLMEGDAVYAEQPDGKVKVTLPLFENIKDAKWIQVYRYDDTAKDFITVDNVVEVKDGKFTFETDHFSTYLFASVAAPEPESTTEPEATTTGKTVTDTSSKPKTGDSAPIAVFAGMAAAGLAVFAVSKKRKNA